jgi:hypothetical protein
MPETIPIACSFEQSELPDRAALMAELGAGLVAVEADGLHASLCFEECRAGLEDFVRAESDCCPFFDFQLSEERGQTLLRVGAPEGGEWAVRGLVAGFVAGWGGLV